MTAPVEPPEASSPTARKAAFGQTVRAVAWSFFGIRRAVDQEQDAKLNPLHVAIAAVLGAAVFVVFLVVLVRVVVGASSH